MEVDGKINFTNSSYKSLTFIPATTGGGRDIARAVWNYFTSWFWAHG